LIPDKLRAPRSTQTDRHTLIDRHEEFAMANAPDEKTLPAGDTGKSAAQSAPQTSPQPAEVSDEQLAAVVGGVLRRGGDDDLDDLEVER
jgi:DNA segregation ATPase FtsK/SpoIIIE-like protein